MDVWMNGWMDEWMYGRMDRCMDVWMYGLLDCHLVLGHQRHRAHQGHPIYAQGRRINKPNNVTMMIIWQQPWDKVHVWSWNWIWFPCRSGKVNERTIARVKSAAIFVESIVRSNLVKLHSCTWWLAATTTLLSKYTSRSVTIQDTSGHQWHTVHCSDAVNKYDVMITAMTQLNHTPTHMSPGCSSFSSQTWIASLALWTM